MRRLVSPWFALYTLAGSAALAAPGDKVAAAFHGEWVPPGAACTSPLKLVIAADAVALVNGSRRTEFRKLDQCYACMGRDVRDMTLLSTEAMGDSPFMITLDARRKGKPALSVDLGNDRKLGAAYPLGTAALKKCS